MQPTVVAPQRNDVFGWHTTLTVDNLRPHRSEQEISDGR
jgi:hypothetical protein